MLHHVSIRTANIHRSIAFYELLGFRVGERFTTGYTLACWLQGLGSRIELIEIPEPKPVADAFGDEGYVGYYHLSFDLTAISASLSDWLNDLKVNMQKKATQTTSNSQELKVLLEPKQQMIGDKIYEVAFIADADGLPLELIRQLR
jgi:catechol 2,3-dioxygenase-like lactoylglutathione lyase family enzyme